MSSVIADLRDEVYTRILTKKAANEFIFNTFSVTKTWRPYNTLETLHGDYPTGRVWVVGGVPGDFLPVARQNCGVRTYSVILGYQRVLAQSIDDVALIDTLAELVEQLDLMCRKEIGDLVSNTNPYSFSRLDYLKDENGVPYSFVMLRKAATFESYISAYFNVTHS